jgi:hypothetical protein
MASAQLVSSVQETDEKSCASDIADPRPGPTKEFYILPIPTRLRYNPELPFKFTYGIAVAYAVVGTLSGYRNTFLRRFRRSSAFHCQSQQICIIVNHCSVTIRDFWITTTCYLIVLVVEMSKSFHVSYDGVARSVLHLRQYNVSTAEEKSLEFQLFYKPGTSFLSDIVISLRLIRPAVTQ